MRNDVFFGEGGGLEKKTRGLSLVGPAINKNKSNFIVIA